MLTPQDVRSVQFEKNLRGYRTEDVDRFLDKRRVAEPEQVGGKVGGDGGERFLVAAGVGKQPPQQRTEQPRERGGEPALVHDLHHAGPKAHDACH